MKNYKVLIPNTLTAANIVCGYYSAICSIQGNFTLAAWFILIAGIFDLFDGRLARMLNASSEFGDHFDTLSDLISFGLAPSILIYKTFLEGLPASAWIISLLYLLAVAFRLARFSIKSNVSKKNFFQGLSSPPAA